MYGQSNFSEVVKKAFNENGVENPQLEKAISDILYSVIESRSLSQYLYKDITEHQERDKHVKNMFK